MTKSKPIRIRSEYYTFDKDYSVEEAEINVYRLQELLAEAFIQYCKKNKLKLK